MKFRPIRSLLVVLALIAFTAFPSVAQSNVYESSEAAKSVDRAYQVDPAIKAAGKNAVFDKLVKKELVSLGTTTFLCPTDTTSTNTASIGYMTGVVPPCKIVVTPYDSATATITYDLYNLTAAGVTAPDTDCPMPLTNGKFEHISFGMPNLIFGASTTGTTTVEVYVPNY